MDILFIEPSGAGGIASYTYALASALARQGHMCHVLTSTRWSFPAHKNLNVHRAFSGKLTNPFSLWWKCWRLARGADIIHWQSATHPEFVTWAMKALPMKSKPWVFTVHNTLPHEEREQKADIYQWIYQRMKGLIFHTTFTKDDFESQFRQTGAKQAIIPHGEMSLLAEARPKFDSKTDPNTILFFGNIRPYKGLDILLLAFKQVLTKHPQARLSIVGQALQPFEPYDEMMEILGVKDHVNLRLGYLPDDQIPDVIHSAGVAALPYRHIDQSGVLLLMMGCGKPVVASNIGGFPEVVHDQQTGLLVPPDNPGELAEALLRCLREPEWAQGIGQAAKLDVRSRFSWDSIAKQTHDFYQDVIHG